MKNAGNAILGVCLCAGGAGSLLAGDEPLVALEASRGRVVDAAHISFNIVTVERVETLRGDGVLGFFDISAFLVLFDAGDPRADFDHSGTFSFFDISAFLAEFSAGCP